MTAKDPIQQFRRWYREARSRLQLPNAMCVSTVNAKGHPTARMLLLKDFDVGGFTFFTNIRSPKAKDLLARPHAALTFYWQPLHRQVRIEGKVLRVAKREADAYFATRPRASQIGSWASQQSAPLVSRQALLSRFNAFAAKFEGAKVPAPDYWQGFRVIAEQIEFWQEGANRLHDRWLYVRKGGRRWGLTRLNP